jgi:hypothetical protein
MEQKFHSQLKSGWLVLSDFGRDILFSSAATLVLVPLQLGLGPIQVYSYLMVQMGDYYCCLLERGCYLGVVSDCQLVVVVVVVLEDMLPLAGTDLYLYLKCGMIFLIGDLKLPKAYSYLTRRIFAFSGFLFSVTSMRHIIFFSLNSRARIFSYDITFLELLYNKYYDASEARHREPLDGLICV